MLAPTQRRFDALALARQGVGATQSSKARREPRQASQEEDLRNRDKRGGERRAAGEEEEEEEEEEGSPGLLNKGMCVKERNNEREPSPSGDARVYVCGCSLNRRERERGCEMGAERCFNRVQSPNI